MDCVHLTPPDPTRWEYTGFVVVVVVVVVVIYLQQKRKNLIDSQNL